MINFFRKIRKQLADDNKPLKYMRYAIGEIVLVVVGILMALSINNWNQEKQIRKLEKGYLIRLVEDLGQDLRNSERTTQNACVNIVLARDALIKLDADRSFIIGDQMDSMANADVAIKDGIIFYKGDSLSTEVRTFGSQLSLMTETYLFGLTQPTFNDLMSTGNIEVIKNQELRNDIQEHYSRISNTLPFEDIYFHPQFNYYRDVLNDLGLPLGNNLTIKEVKGQIGDDFRLRVAINNLYRANHGVITMNNKWRKIHILWLKSKIEASLEDL